MEAKQRQHAAASTSKCFALSLPSSTSPCRSCDCVTYISHKILSSNIRNTWKTFLSGKKKFPSSPCFSSTQSLASSVAIFCNTLSEDTDQTTRWLITSVVTKRWPCHFLCTSKDSQLKEALVINYWQALSCWFLSTCFLLYLSKYWASRQLLFSFFFPKFFFKMKVPIQTIHWLGIEIQI